MSLPLSAASTFRARTAAASVANHADTPVRECSSRKRASTACRVLVSILGMLTATSAHADWHSGVITRLGVGYDGSTITFALSGWTRTNCTCYSSWPTYMCLQRSRTSFREEFAMLLRLKSEGGTINVNIDEASCSVIAFDEPQ